MNIVRTSMSLNISIETVMKNPEMLKIVPDHLKTKNICKHPTKILPFLIRYAPDQYKIQQVCDNTILKNGGTLNSVPDCNKKPRNV